MPSIYDNSYNVDSSLALQPSGLVKYTPNNDGTYNFANNTGNSLAFGFNANDFMNNNNIPVSNNNGLTWQQGLNYGLAGLQALSGLANAYTGYKNYQLAKQQFGFEKAAMNRNIANQAKIINNAYDNAAQVAAGMVGAKDNAGNYGMTNQEVVDKYAANAEKKHVDGSSL